jgi:hypothetical protein
MFLLHLFLRDLTWDLRCLWPWRECANGCRLRDSRGNPYTPFFLWLVGGLDLIILKRREGEGLLVYSLLISLVSVRYVIRSFGICFCVCLRIELLSPVIVGTSRGSFCDTRNRAGDQVWDYRFDTRWKHHRKYFFKISRFIGRYILKWSSIDNRKTIDRWNSRYR